MEQEDSNSTINNNIKNDNVDFADASDSFESDYRTLVSNHSSKEISSSDAFANRDFKKSINIKDNQKSKRARSSSRSHRKVLPEESNHDSVITSVIDDETINHNEAITSDSPVSGSSFLFAFSGLVIKIIGFQLNLFVSSATIPIWLTYYSYMFMINPFASTRLAKVYILDKLSRVFGVSYRCVKSIFYIWIRKTESSWKLCFQIGWGLLWSVYVGFILISLLVFAFLFSGVIMKCVLVKPLQITEPLNFDYTKDSPVAFVPLMSCPDPTFLECSELIKSGLSAESRVIPLDHKVYATVSLTLPESHYNRNLGVFQDISVYPEASLPKLTSDIISPRPDIDDVLSNPSFWHPNVHLEYLRELSDQLETPVGVSLLRPKIESIKSKVFPPATQQWNSEFTSTLMTEMVQKRGGKKYNHSTVASLLRFKRNIINHHATIPQTELTVIGVDRVGLEYTFRQKFPKLFMKVRVDFLSGNGQRLASTRQPCMLQFKSQPIRLMLTLLNIAPLLSGYSSESQKINIKFRGYTERNEPTSCLRVIMEQRAEFKKGAGVPEIYEASLKLESQPPFLKRILWYWKGTIYIWVSIMMFVIELLFTIVCCTPIIVPWVQPRGVSVNNNER